MAEMKPRVRPGFWAARRGLSAGLENDRHSRAGRGLLGVCRRPAHRGSTGGPHVAAGDGGYRACGTDRSTGAATSRPHPALCPGRS